MAIHEPSPLQHLTTRIGLALGLTISMGLWPCLALADHEPPSYSYAAKSGLLPSRHLATLSPSPSPQPFAVSGERDEVIEPKLDDILQGAPRVALGALAVHQRKIVYEKYLNGGADNLYPSWSMAKSLVSLTLGHALCEKKVGSLEDRAEQYSAHLRGTPWGEAKIVDLLTMSSGASTKGLHPSDGDYAYAGSGLSYLVSRNRLTVHEAFKKVGHDDGKKPSGSAFAYNNLDTEAIALVIAGATQESFSDYFNRKVWSQIHPEHRGIWMLDSQKQAISHAYFFASLRDYAKVAQYLIDILKGRTGDDCLRNFVKSASSPQKHVAGSIWYGYQFWIYGARGDVFAMWGHQGQEIMIHPESEKILVLAAHNSSIRTKYRNPNNLLPWLRASAAPSRVQ
jgi:CubicO group peptidase (beta-lactamase class C family)